MHITAFLKALRRAIAPVLLGLVALNGGPAVAAVVDFQSTVVVSPVGLPDANGAALLAALAGIVASAGNPVLLKLEPGVYDVGDEPVHMKAFVDLEGSGRTTTLIRGEVRDAFSAGEGVVTVVDDSELRTLAVESYATGDAVDSAAIVVAGGSSARVTDVAASATGTSPINRAVLVRPFGAASRPVLTNVLATAATRAVQILGPGAEVENLTAVGPTESLFVSSGAITARNSIFRGPLLGPAIGGPMVFVATQLDGPLTCIGGQCRCIAAYDGAFAALDATCSTPPGRRPF